MKLNEECAGVPFAMKTLESAGGRKDFGPDKRKSTLGSRYVSWKITCCRVLGKNYGRNNDSQSGAPIVVLSFSLSLP